MRRRTFIGFVGGAVVARPLTARAEATRKLGVLLIGAENDPVRQRDLAAFQKRLSELGWEDGKNIKITYRWAAGREDLTRQYARELVALAPDLILASGTPCVAALKPLTSTIPIVAAAAIDPVGLGFVNSLSEPGGNITGFTFVNPELIGKWTALLKEAAPGLDRAALLYDPKINPWYAHFMEELAATPHSTALRLVPTLIETAGDLQTKIPPLADAAGASLIIGPEAFVFRYLHEVAQLAAAKRLPGISVYRKFVTEGGLMSYGPLLSDIFRRSADYVDRILKGANPAELPVQQPTKFEFAVNQKAAAGLGLKLSPTLLSLADEVIE
jgi:ABC-type uncharacterized transport system substrate-binding protein